MCMLTACSVSQASTFLASVMFQVLLPYQTLGIQGQSLGSGRWLYCNSHSSGKSWGIVGHRGHSQDARWNVISWLFWGHFWVVGAEWYFWAGEALETEVCREGKVLHNFPHFLWNITQQLASSSKPPLMSRPLLNPSRSPFSFSRTLLLPSPTFSFATLFPSPLSCPHWYITMP